MSRQRVREGFLIDQREQGMALAAASEILDLLPVGGPAPERYVARFRCRGLVREGDGEPTVAEQFIVGLWFPEDYFDRVAPIEIVTWLAPATIWHPNIAAGPRGGLVCLGHIRPSTPLVELLERTYEVITYQNVTMNEHDALNRAACSWARHNCERFPLETRSVYGTTGDFDCFPTGEDSE